MIDRAVSEVAEMTARMYAAHPVALRSVMVRSGLNLDLAGDGRHGRPRRDSTRRKIVEVVQLAWEWAYNEDEWSASVPRPRTIEMRREEGELTVALTWAEMDAVIRAFDQEAWHHKLGILLRFTGLRVQQVMGLTWEDLDLERATLRVRGELRKSRQERRGRIIPISKHLVDILSGWGRREGFVITTNRRGRRERLARPRDLDRAWARADVRAAASKGRPHHAFRKGFVSELRRAGADPDAVEYLVGHSLGLRGVYTDPDALALREAVALIPPLTATTSQPIPCLHIDNRARGRRGTAAATSAPCAARSSPTTPS